MLQGWISEWMYTGPLKISRYKKLATIEYTELSVT